MFAFRHPTTQNSININEVGKDAYVVCTHSGCSIEFFKELPITNKKPSVMNFGEKFGYFCLCLQKRNTRKTGLQEKDR